jgi:hypothetical protein
MAARIEVRMPSPEGVGAGQTATFRLPVGRRYHSLQIEYSGTDFTLAHMTEIRVLANGKVIQRFSGTERDALNQFDGLAAAAGILVIPFDRVGLKLQQAEEETALNTGSRNPDTGYIINSVAVEIDIASAADAPVLSMTASQSDQLPGGPVTVLHILRPTKNPTGAGVFEISDLPRGTRTSIALNRITFIPSANDISKLVVERDSRTIFERSKALNERVQANGVRTPQSGYHVIDTTEGGYGGQPIGLLGAADYRYKLTMTGAADITILAEYLGQLGD